MSISRYGLLTGMVGVCSILMAQYATPLNSLLLMLDGAFLLGFALKSVVRLEIRRDPHFIRVNYNRHSQEFFSGWNETCEWKSILGNWSYIVVGIALVLRYLFFR